MGHVALGLTKKLEVRAARCDRCRAHGRRLTRYTADMRPISKLRFNSLAGFARQPQTTLYAEELGWFEHANERSLGVLIRDRTDGDYAGIVLARDELLQYRWTTMTEFEPSLRGANARLRPALERAAMAPDE